MATTSPPPPDLPRTAGADATQAADGRPFDGRRLLEDRIVLLEATVADLSDALLDPACREQVSDGHQRATQELARLRQLLDGAVTLEDVVDDPWVVEPGDHVAIRLDDGTEEAYVIVRGADAVLGDGCILAESPLGRALLTRHVGETVEVAVPGGKYRCTILSAARRARVG